jgi:hypothetical protein
MPTHVVTLDNFHFLMTRWCLRVNVMMMAVKVLKNSLSSRQQNSISSVRYCFSHFNIVNKGHGNDRDETRLRRNELHYGRSLNLLVLNLFFLEDINSLKNY